MKSFYFFCFFAGSLLGHQFSRTFSLELALLRGLVIGAVAFLTLTDRLPALSNLKNAGKVLCCSALLAWGYLTAGVSATYTSYARTASDAFTIAGTNIGPWVPGPLLVQSQDGTIFEARGAGQTGDRGKLRFHMQPHSTREAAHFTRNTSMVSQSPIESSFAAWSAPLRWIQAHGAAVPLAIIFGNRAITAIFRGESVFLRNASFLTTVNGMHVVAFHFLISGLLFGCGRAVYALRLIAPKHWEIWDTAARPVVACVTLVYAFAFGQASAHRLGCTLALNHAIKAGLAPKLNSSERLSFLLGAQMLLFPIGILELDSILSWCVYLFYCEMPAWIRQARSELGIRFYIYALLIVVFAGLLGNVPWSIYGTGLVVIPIFFPIFFTATGSLAVRILATMDALRYSSVLRAMDSAMRALMKHEVRLFGAICDGPSLEINAWGRVGALALVAAVLLLRRRPSELRP